MGALIFDTFYGAVTGTGCTVSGNNLTQICNAGYFGGHCQYKMPSGSVFSHAVRDADADGMVDELSLVGYFSGVEVVSLEGPPGFLPISYVGNTSVEISVLTRKDLDSINPGLAPDPSWLKSNMLATDPRYMCALSGASLAADYILKMKPAGLTFKRPLQLGMDATGVPDLFPCRERE